MKEPEPSVPESPRPPEPIEISQEKARAEVAKLNLEIELLRRQKSIFGRTLQIGPLIAVAAACVSVMITIDQSRDQSKRAYTQQQSAYTQQMNGLYRSDLEELQKFPVEPKQTLARTRYLFEELSRTIDTLSQIDTARHQQDRRNIAAQLFQLVTSSDFNVNSRRMVEFEHAICENWPEYDTLLIDSVDNNCRILTIYLYAIRKQRSIEPGLWLQLNPVSNTFLPQNDTASSYEPLAMARALVEAFKIHIGYIDLAKVKHSIPTDHRREEMIDKFRIATADPELTAFLWGAGKSASANGANRDSLALAPPGGKKISNR
jgi:hypothetical protein